MDTETTGRPIAAAALKVLAFAATVIVTSVLAGVVLGVLHLWGSYDAQSMAAGMCVAGIPFLMRELAESIHEHRR